MSQALLLLLLLSRGCAVTEFTCNNTSEWDFEFRVYDSTPACLIDSLMVCHDEEAEEDCASNCKLSALMGIIIIYSLALCHH